MSLPCCCRRSASICIPRFRIYSVAGLAVAYIYFQLPLLILLVIPALLGLRREWREAATSLGRHIATQYWLRVGLPILAPSLLGSFLLLFANAFGAYATAWTLTGPDVNLVTVQIAALVRGEVQLDPALADALALLSLGIMAICVAGYQWLRGSSAEARLMKGGAALACGGNRPVPRVHDRAGHRDGPVLGLDAMGSHDLAGGVSPWPGGGR